MNFFSQPGFKNKIINGCMRLWQRGTSIVVGQAEGKFTLDRWNQYNSHTAGNITVTQDASVPNSRYQYSLKVNNAAGSYSPVGSGNLCYLTQPVEGFNICPLVPGLFTLSFWVKSSKTGIYCVGLRCAGFNRSYAAEFQINAANTWEFKSITVDLSAGVTAGTWNYTNGVGFYVHFSLTAGSAYFLTPGSWQNANGFCTSNQVNWLNEQNNTFYITGVQLEQGAYATDFEQRGILEELALCQRYFCKTYNLYVAPGSNSNNGMISSMGTAAGGTGFTWGFPVTMRSTPVMKYYDWAGTVDKMTFYISGTGWVNGYNAATYMNYQTSQEQLSAAATNTVSNAYLASFHLTAEAEL